MRYFSIVATFSTLLVVTPAWAQTVNGTDALPARAPWQSKVAAKQANPIYQQVWKRADNRRQCAPLVLPRNAAAHLPSATSRRAVFSGGWAVAYDTPQQRSAYGIAGAGVVAQPADIKRWPKQHQWSDGSAMGWGLEGDTGPKHLAYVQVMGQTCLYNVWSAVSEEHLLGIIQDLRRLR